MTTDTQTPHDRAIEAAARALIKAQGGDPDKELIYGEHGLPSAIHEAGFIVTHYLHTLAADPVQPMTLQPASIMVSLPPQEPLGHEFEAAIFNDVEGLYEAQPVAPAQDVNAELLEAIAALTLAETQWNENQDMPAFKALSAAIDKCKAAAAIANATKGSSHE